MENDHYVGRLLDGRYEILEVIGIGGMAVVYKAKCHRLNRLVAIKILKDEYSQDEEFRNRFHAESQGVAMLSHPNIVSVYDVSSSIAADYIVMELIEGITLKQYMEKKGVLNWKETLHFAIQIAKALEHAHSKGIVHRDIKPHNVMVLKNGTVKVADFGIAQTMGSGNTATTEALGSVHYVAPEQAKGGRVDNRSDIYALGIVMYEMIAGRVPYDGENPVSVAIQHINGGAKVPSTYNANVPRGLEQIIMKAMALLPKDRYATATALLYDIDEFRKNPAIVFPESTAENSSTMVMPANIHAGLAEQKARAEKEQEEQEDQEDDEPPVVPVRRRRREEEEEEGTNRVTTIAVISCVVVGVVALVIFMILLSQGGLLAQPQLVRVPNLVGLNFENVQKNPEKYPDIVIKKIDEVYSDEHPDGKIISQSPAAGDEIKAGDKVFVTVSLGPRPEQKPMEDLSGKTKIEAQQIIDNMHMDLTVEFREENNDSVPAGKVIRTDPVAGDFATKGGKVTVYISLGVKTQSGQVPGGLVGKDVTMAQNILAGNGFKNVISMPIASYESKNKVVWMSVESGTSVDTTTQIILYISSGDPKGTLPDVAGKTGEEAVKLLKENGFFNIKQVSVGSDTPAGAVLSQSLTAGTSADVTTEITLYVSSGDPNAIIPNVVGMSYADAVELLKKHNFTIVQKQTMESIEPEGTVLEQSAAANTTANVNDTIVLTVAVPVAQPL